LRILGILPESERDSREREKDRQGDPTLLVHGASALSDVEVILDRDLDRDNVPWTGEVGVGVPSDEPERRMRRFPASSAFFKIPSRVATRSSSDFVVVVELLLDGTELAADDVDSVDVSRFSTRISSACKRLFVLSIMRRISSRKRSSKLAMADCSVVIESESASTGVCCC